MSQFLFLRPLLDSLHDGRVMRRSVAAAIGVAAVLILLAGGYLVVEVLRLSFRLPVEGSVGGMVFCVALVAAVVVIAEILLCRAEDIRDLGDSAFTVFPIASLLCRAAGEAYAAAGISVAAGGCLMIWFAKVDPLYMLGPLGGFFPAVAIEGTFLGGLRFLVIMALVSFLVLVFFYFLAESIVVLVDIALNLRLLRRQFAGPAPAPVLAAAAPGQAPPAAHCPVCSAEVEPDSGFCTRCGTDLRVR